MIRARFRPRPMADWRCSPIAPDVPAAVEAAAVAYLGAREAHQVAFDRYLEARAAGTVDDPGDRSECDLEIACDRVVAAGEALRAALDGRRGWHPAGGMLVGLASTRYGLAPRAEPAAMSPYHPLGRPYPQ